MDRSKKSSLSRDELKQKCIQDMQSMEVHRDTIKTLIDDLKDILIEQRTQGKTVQALARQLERTLGQTMKKPPSLSYLIRQIGAVTAPAFRKEKTSDPTAATAARVLPGRPAAAVQNGAGATAGRSAPPCGRTGAGWSKAQSVPAGLPGKRSQRAVGDTKPDRPFPMLTRPKRCHPITGALLAGVDVTVVR